MPNWRNPKCRSNAATARAGEPEGPESAPRHLCAELTEAFGSQPISTKRTQASFAFSHSARFDDRQKQRQMLAAPGPGAYRAVDGSGIASGGVMGVGGADGGGIADGGGSAMREMACPLKLVVLVGWRSSLPRTLPWTSRRRVQRVLILFI